MIFGRNFCSLMATCHRLSLSEVSFVEEWKYLGITLKADREFSCVARHSLNSFYRAANSILNVIHKPSEVVLMMLL